MAVFENNRFTSGTSNGITVPVVMPAVVNSGDALSAFVRFGDIDTFYSFYNGLLGVAPPTGWTIVSTAFVAGIFFTAYAKVATGSEGGTTVNFSYNTGGGAASVKHKYLAVVHRMSDTGSFNVPSYATGDINTWAQSGSAGSATAVISDLIEGGTSLVVASLTRASTTFTNISGREAQTLDVSSEDGAGQNIKLDVGHILDVSGASDPVLSFSGFCQGIAVSWDAFVPVNPPNQAAAPLFTPRNRRVQATELPFHVNTTMDEDDLWR